MSTPPYPPSTPGENPNPEQPQYGQQPPQYGQPSAPQYGQQAPQYGQQAPQYGQPSAPQYGQAGQSAWPSQLPATTSGVPQLVTISFWLILAAGVLTLIGIPFAIASLNSPTGKSMIEQAMTSQGSNAAGVDTNSIIGVVVVILVIFSVVFAGLYALVAFNVRKGKNWARILGTVFAAVSLLGLSQIGLGTITILMGVAAIVLLYLPASAPYFRKAQPFANPYNQAPYGR